MNASSSRRLNAEHGIVCRLPGARFGYFGWPTVARLDDGTLVVASSGLRAEHVCPFGKTVLNVSKDDGRTWSEPRVIQDSMIDDRDAGIVNLGGKMLLVSWFRSDTRQFAGHAWITNDAALIAYSEFNLPGPDGRPCKSIRVREVSTALGSETQGHKTKGAHS